MCKGLATLPACCLERAKELKERLRSILQKPNWTLACCKIGKNKYALQQSKQLPHEFTLMHFQVPSKHGLCAFTAFLVSEFSEENVAFYFACEDYRKTKCPAKLPAKAQKIYNEFIGSEAPREINIDHETRDITKANMQDPSPSCFDLAQHRIYMLMAKDCYPRFLHSPAYRSLLCQARPRAGAISLPQEKKV
uniref:Regulator of G protein signaling 16 n=1 Tax=Nothobranchius furzeri TaxID=105023 RepID=A0A8C6NU43_NOTFU